MSARAIGDVKRSLVTDDVIEAVAVALFGAYTARQSIVPPEALAGLTLSEAYAVQDALVARRVAAGSTLRGWKLGITSPVKHEITDSRYRSGVRTAVVVLAGSTADVLGDPLNALAALAAHLETHGYRAEAGDVVLSGAITDAIVVAPGDTVEARIAGLGTASVTFR